jgi:hypothetical protein
MYQFQTERACSRIGPYDNDMHSRFEKAYDSAAL